MGIRFAHVHERVLTKSFVVLIIGNSKSNHLDAQGTFNGQPERLGRLGLALNPWEVRVNPSRNSLMYMSKASLTIEVN